MQGLIQYADTLHVHSCRLLSFFLSDTAEKERECDIFFRVHGRNQTVTLKNKSDMLAAKTNQLLLVHFLEFFSEYMYVAAARRLKSGKQIQAGGFTGAGSADNCEKTARIQVKTDPVQSVNLALADVIYLF